MDKRKAVETVKELLGITGGDADGLIEILVDTCTGYVLGYCRRQELPPALEPVVSMMAADLYRVKKYGEQASRTVKTVSQGERSVTYEDESRDDVFGCYNDRLKPYIRRCGRLPSEVDHGECI